MAFFTKLEQMLRFVQKRKTIAKTIVIKTWNWRTHNPCLHTTCKSSWHCPGTETVGQISALAQEARKCVHTLTAKQLGPERRARTMEERQARQEAVRGNWTATCERVKSEYALTSQQCFFGSVS